MCVSRMQQQGLLYCTQNPTTGEEYRRGWHPEKFDRVRDACSVLVVGGGPAGMECALTLGRRGYRVHLRDDKRALGGHWTAVSNYPRAHEYGRVISWRETMLRKLPNVELHLGVARLSASDVLDYGARKVVIATGAHWSPGAGQGHRPPAELCGVHLRHDHLPC
jgi:dimethylamine/trimethylamine dehydrogenase